MLVLNAMDLPCKAIVDLDYAFNQAITDGFLQANDEDIIACRTEMAVISDPNNIVLNNGWPINRNSSMSASEAISLLARSNDIQENIQNIKIKLQAYNIWIWTKGCIEKHMNLEGKSEGIWARFKNEVDVNGLENTLPNDHEEITACVNWILN